MATRRLPFLDANIFLRHIMGDDPDHSRRATAYFERIERGELSVRTADTVVFETVFTLQSFYRVPREQIREKLLPLLLLTGLHLPAKRSYRQVFALYVSRPGLSFADCYHVVLVRRLKLPALVSFDAKLGRIPGITRDEPPTIRERDGRA